MPLGSGASLSVLGLTTLSSFLPNPPPIMATVMAPVSSACSSAFILRDRFSLSLAPLSSISFHSTASCTGMETICWTLSNLP